MLFSTLLGIWTVLTGYFICMEPIMDHLKQFHLGQTRNPNLPLTKYLSIMTGASALVMLAAMSVYWICLAVVENDPAWEVQVRAKCPDHFVEPNQTIERFYSGFILSNFGCIGFIMGAYAGTLYQYKRFDGHSQF